MSECQKFLAVLRTHRNTYAFALRAHMNPVFVDWSLTGKGETCQEEPSTVPWRKATLSVPTIPKIGNCFRSGSHPSKRTPARSIEDNAQGNAQGRVIFEFLYPLFHSPRSHTISFHPPRALVRRKARGRTFVCSAVPFIPFACFVRSCALSLTGLLHILFFSSVL